MKIIVEHRTSDNNTHIDTYEATSWLVDSDDKGLSIYRDNELIGEYSYGWIRVVKVEN